MYESLKTSRFDKIVCVVLTGMGADGTEGIKNLKESKKIHVISQDEESSTIYGMPKAVFKAGLSDQVVPLDSVAAEIVMQVGLNS
jgi:two-component system chemotaxis response regulator CheB